MERIIKRVRPAVEPVPMDKRVAAYARVSNGKDAMLHSLSAQVSYYSALIQKTPGWDYAGVYADEAISGTKNNRAEFQRLMGDCRAGRIDLIITKSISRFARNTVTTLEAIRELRVLGVDVYFEEQNIHTLGEEGEFVLTLLAAYAEEEARSASENQMWRIRRNFEQGRSTSIDMFGYKFVNGRLEIVPEEAELIRRAAQMYLGGASQEDLKDMFSEAGVVGRHGRPMSGYGIIGLLCNEKIVGDMLLQKTRCIDPISKIHKVNNGEWPQYFVEGSHEGILDRDTYERVLAERERRAKALGMDRRNCRRKKRAFTCRIICGKCGKHFVQRQWDSKKYGLRASWHCRSRVRDKNACDIIGISEVLLKNIAADVLGMDCFDVGVFQKKIREVRVPENGRLEFVFMDGHIEERRHNFERLDTGRCEICR